MQHAQNDEKKSKLLVRRTEFAKRDKFFDCPGAFTQRSETLPKEFSMNGTARHGFQNVRKDLGPGPRQTITTLDSHRRCFKFTAPVRTWHSITLCAY